jgi:hypothetical protein
MRQQLLLVATLVLLSADAWLVQARRDSPDCPGGCIIPSVLTPKRECKCVVPSCSWQKTFGLRNTRRRRSNGRTRKPQVGSGLQLQSVPSLDTSSSTVSPQHPLSVRPCV